MYGREPVAIQEDLEKLLAALADLHFCRPVSSFISCHLLALLEVVPRAHHRVAVRLRQGLEVHRLPVNTLPAQALGVTRLEDNSEHITHFATDLEVVAMALLIWAQNVLTVEEHLGLCVSQMKRRLGARCWIEAMLKVCVSVDLEIAGLLEKLDLAVENARVAAHGLEKPEAVVAYDAVADAAGLSHNAIHLLPAHTPIPAIHLQPDLVVLARSASHPPTPRPVNVGCWPQHQ
mmetsp:Transcript_33602/g.80629  ORF Transcript_33602/g.80629 Transcript_33602/m.80629 type:complete len:233 (+) Transcript_33602:609-1307(+)